MDFKEALFGIGPIHWMYSFTIIMKNKFFVYLIGKYLFFLKSLLEHFVGLINKLQKSLEKILNGITEF